MTLQATQEWLEDERIWCVGAVVVLIEGQTEHWQVQDDGQVVVSVATLRRGIVMDAVLPGGDKNGTGIWFIPAIGTEVVVAFDEGEVEGDPYIVGIHGRSPSGLAPDKVLVIGSTVEVRSKTGTAEKLPTFDDVKDLRDWAATQLYGGSGSAVPIGPGLPPNPVGTTVLKAQ